jgi:Sodium/hydrogen exchanger family
MSYLAGLIVPHRALLVELVCSVDQVNAVLFLPLFFVLSGLRAQLGLISAVMLWLVCLLILLVAYVGKFTGGSLPVRFIGRSWQEALSLGGAHEHKRSLLANCSHYWPGPVGMLLSSIWTAVLGNLCREAYMDRSRNTEALASQRCDQPNAREETEVLSPPSQLAGREQSAEGTLPTLLS